VSTPPKPADPSFDAIAAARELEESLAEEGDGGPAVPAVFAEGYESMLEAELVELNALLDQRDARIRGLERELELSRDRIEREARKDAEQRVRHVVLGFLDLADDLDRALDAARASGQGSALVEGVELVRRRLIARLDELGVRPRPAQGERFDPALHEAVATVGVADASRHDHVVDVVQQGWTIGDALLRPARVTVGKLGR
jgi:molecular chaperone GrpE